MTEAGSRRGAVVKSKSAGLACRACVPAHTCWVHRFRGSDEGSSPRRPAQMVMLSALLSWSAAAPAVADEVTYLTYLKGPRARWRHSACNGTRSTTPRPHHHRPRHPYEAWLKKLGLGRVQAFDAKLNRQEFVVRISCSRVSSPSSRATSCGRTDERPSRCDAYNDGAQSRARCC